MNCTLNRLGVPKRFNQDWTPEEDAEMMRDYQIMGAAYMAKKLHRSRDSVTARARRLGLSRTWVLAQKVD